MLGLINSMGNVIKVSMPHSILPGKLLLYYPFTYDTSNYVSGTASSDLTQTGTCNIVMNNTYYRICCDISSNSGYFLLPSTAVLNDPVLGYGISVSIYFNILSDSTPTANTDRILSFDNGIIDVFISSITVTAPSVSSFTINVNTPNNTFTSSALNTNTVHHLVINQNFNTSSGSIYINKTLVYSSNLQLSSTTLSSSYIGKYYTGSTLNTMRMQVFGFRLYNRALSSTEITTLYNAEYPTGSAVSSSSLVLHYPMIDNSFNITRGAGTNLVTTGTPSILKNTDTKRYACNFTNGASYFTLPSFTITSAGRYISISLWFNVLSDLRPTSGNDRIICWDGTNGARFFLRMNGTYSTPPTSNWSFSFNDTGFGTAINLATNVFHHIVVLYDTTRTQLGGLYINNILISNLSTTSIAALSIPTKTYTVARIGKSSFNDPNNSCHTQWFDYRIYNRLLTSTEIGRLYTDISNNLYLNKYDIINVS
jgi:hypothetical protein